jgi:hypothetical protein
VKRTGFKYEVKTAIEFTLDELKTLISASESHYDRACRALTKEGGVLFGMRNIVLFAGSTEERPVSNDELGLLVKVAETIHEPAHAALWAVLGKLLNEGLARQQDAQNRPWSLKERP